MESKEEQAAKDYSEGLKMTNFHELYNLFKQVENGFKAGIEWQKSQQKPITVERITDIMNNEIAADGDGVLYGVLKAAKQLHSELQPIEEVKSDALWFKPFRRPNYSKDDVSFSDTVLLYNNEMDYHTVGWFDFERDKWMWEADEDMGNDFEWTYLEKPATKIKTIK